MRRRTKITIRIMVGVMVMVVGFVVRVIFEVAIIE